MDEMTPVGIFDRSRALASRLSRRQMLRDLAAAGTVAIGASTLTAAASAAQTPKIGGSVKLAQSSDATTLDPAHSTATVDANIYLAVFDQLVDLDPEGAFVPLLAESWEESPDNLSWTLHLRQGVKFHDGTDFNADAVKVTIERYINPQTNSPRAGEIPYVTGVTVVDTYTAKINLSRPFVMFMYSMAGTTGNMMSPAAIQKYGADLARNPVGTGAFVFKEWIKGDHVTVTRNPNYWRKGLPYLDSVTYQGIADTNAIINGMKSGAIQATYGIPAQDVKSLKSDPNLQLIVKPSTSVTSLRLNNAVAPFNNHDLRQAVSWAIDRAAIEKAIFYSTGLPANTFLGPLNLGFNKDISLYKTVDIAKAKQSLASGGKPNGFKFTAQTGNTPQALQLAQAIKSQLESINVDMELQLVDGVTLLNNLVAKQFTATFVTFNGGVEPFQGFNRFFYSKSTLDVYGYDNPQYDALLMKAAATSDNAARAQIYQQMTALLSEDCPWIFLRYPATTELFSANIKGYVFNPDGGIRFDPVYLGS